MDGRRYANKRWNKHISWFGTGFLLLVCGVIGLCFTGFPGKVKRGLREIFAPKPVVIAPDEDAIRRKIEAQLRPAMEQELERQVAALKKAAAEKAAQQAAAAEAAARAAPVATAEVGSVTDVRKLRSGIPFKTEVKMEKGKTASRERVDDASYTAFYQLTLRLPTPARTMAELEGSNPDLSKMLPGLAALIGKA
ncbi:MAG: hypothetical protein NTV46_02380, partial [Verrucomicrobia bacterium]|nr:hypothetical protein [Verrucomicrobiota bacterium]